jgi:Ets-domain/Sterile alpha motif (SAM)/Pointed domain
MENINILYEAIDAVLDEFDVHEMGVPCDPKQWSHENVETCLKWIIETIEFQNVDLSTLIGFTGYQLISMGRDQLVALAPKHFGVILWELMETLNNKSIQNLKLNVKPRRFGKRRDLREILLWQFILELLIDVRYLNIISFTGRYEWEFQIHDIDKIAHLWAIRCSKRSKMTIENFNRTLRTYYKNNGDKYYNGIMCHGPYSGQCHRNYIGCYRFIVDMKDLIVDRGMWYQTFMDKLKCC